MSFIWEVARRALESSVASVGTTVFGICFAFIIATTSVCLRFRKDGRDAMKKHWREELSHFAKVSIVGWVLLLGYHVWVVCKGIEEASVASANQAPKVVGVAPNPAAPLLGAGDIDQIAKEVVKRLPPAKSERTDVAIEKVVLTGLGGVMPRPAVEVYYRHLGVAMAEEKYAVGKVYFLTDVPSVAEKSQRFSDFFKHPTDPPYTLSTLGINQARYLSFPVQDFRDNDWLNGARWLYVIGSIAFSDQSGPHHTDFCYFSVPPNLHKRMRLPSFMNNLKFLEHWLPCDVHNDHQ